MAIPIIFNAILSNNINTNSMVNVGQSQQAGWLANEKRLKNNGSNNGINCSLLLWNALINNVWIDSQAIVPTANISPQNQAI